MKRIVLILVIQILAFVTFGQTHDAPSNSGNGGYISTGNYAGTGNAAYFPSGIYTNGSYSWFYGNIAFGFGSLYDRDNKWRINPAGNSWFNGGNVGIGTSTPGALLTIDKNMAGTPTSYMLRLMNSAGTNTPTADFQIENEVGHLFGLHGRSGTGNSDKLIQAWNLNTGNVGIGTANPSGTLTVYKSEYPLFEMSSSISKLQISIAKNAWDWAKDSKPSDIVFRPLLVGNSDHHGMIFMLSNNYNDGNSYIKFGDDANGCWVGIFNNRIFRVDGLFIAKEIKVRADVWSDNVFNKSYNLPSLKSVEEFINANGHLPEVPSENQVKDDGINLAEMNATLLKKIEEITLYVIELNKKVNNLEEQNVELKNRLEKENK